MNALLNHRGTIVIGGTESDAHVVSIYLIALSLEQNGFRVENMRGFNSVADFVERARSTNAKAIVISNQNGSAYDDLIGLSDALGADSEIPVILGGHYFVGVGDSTIHEERLRSVGVTHVCSTIDSLIDYLFETVVCDYPLEIVV
ncbi:MULTISPECIES: cobalamin B12-binding domain-containing protein [unclassified Pseudomonas]|uniref:cobalamin B12-binding domain-containing protein n=1 Tax=unclassified Pseudomonas TaxID=196821 RepID=UPI000BA40FB0|nr:MULTISPECIES: cobalamin-dependent protein [unclassified Pseudomonas]